MTNEEYEEYLEKGWIFMKEIVTLTRKWKIEHNIPLKKYIDAYVQCNTIEDILMCIDWSEPICTLGKLNLFIIDNVKT